MGSDLKFYRGTGETSSLGPGEVNGPVIARHEPCGVSAVEILRSTALEPGDKPPPLPPSTPLITAPVLARCDDLFVR